MHKLEEPVTRCTVSIFNSMMAEIVDVMFTDRFNNIAATMRAILRDGLDARKQRHQDRPREGQS